ncbi:hypothetical protein Hanom_Chr03g00195811 [Helianthus anomalus]
MLVHATPEWIQTLGTFLKPFTTRLWITLVCACILTGIAVALLEYRADNPKFASPFYKQLLMVIWFPISTFFFHEGTSFMIFSHLNVSFIYTPYIEDRFIIEH